MKKAKMAWNTAINELKRPPAMLVIALINSETADDMVGAMIIVCDSVSVLELILNLYNQNSNCTSLDRHYFHWSRLFSVKYEQVEQQGN